MKPKQKVVITGFGVFRNYSTNPSWEAVRLLDLSDLDAEFVRLQIPVVYDVVEREVSTIWTQHNPSLVIHCGVSCRATGITLEKRAVCNMERYCKPDVNECLPKNRFESNQHPVFIETKLNLDLICNDLNDSYEKGDIRIPGVISEKAGEYLCEYIYLNSLKKNRHQTLFIHVPEVSSTLTEADISNALKVAIASALKQVN